MPLRLIAEEEDKVGVSRKAPAEVLQHMRCPLCGDGALELCEPALQREVVPKRLHHLPTVALKLVDGLVFTFNLERFHRAFEGNLHNGLRGWLRADNGRVAQDKTSILSTAVVAVFVLRATFVFSMIRLVAAFVLVPFGMIRLVRSHHLLCLAYLFGNITILVGLVGVNVASARNVSRSLLPRLLNAQVEISNRTSPQRIEQPLELQSELLDGWQLWWRMCSKDRVLIVRDFRHSTAN